MNRFRPHSDTEIRQALEANQWRGGNGSRDAQQMAVDMLEDRHLEHVEAALSDRHRLAMSGAYPIKPIAIPLLERYAAEAASGYNRPVKREVINGDGAVQEQLSEDLTKGLGDISYDLHMHRLEQLLVVLRRVGQWWQIKRGTVRPSIVLPQSSHAVESPGEDFSDPTDQDDYLAHVVQISETESQGYGRDANSLTYAWISPAETAFYRGQTPWTPERIVGYPNALTWPQAADLAYGEAEARVQTLPLSPLTWWLAQEPVGTMTAGSDVGLAQVNLEIDLQLSLLMNTMSRQGWSQLVYHALNPSATPMTFPLGANEVVSLAGNEESLEYLTGAAPYMEIVGVLRYLVQLLAIAHRQSPNDFSPDAGPAASGFAKLVDSLPKLEARDEHLAQMKRLEERHAWPRMAASLSYVSGGPLAISVEQLAQYRLRTTFAELDFPRAPSEVIAMEAHDLEHGLRTRTEIYAERHGITEADAEKQMGAAEVSAEAEAGGEQPQERGLGGASVDVEVQQTALNGAQVASMAEVVSQVAAGQLPRSSGVSILQIAFQLTPQQAEAIIGDAGAGFEPASKQGEGAPPQGAEPEPEQEQKSQKSGGLNLGDLLRRRKKEEK